MKKLVAVLLSVFTAVTCLMSFSSCGNDSIYVITNAFFAPFEYYDEVGNIAGVDVDIMNKVGEKLGKKVVIENADFGVIIDSVEQGKKYDCGAAGLTVTEARKQKVDFSNTYFTSVQYVVYRASDEAFASLLKKTNDGKDCFYWSDLAGKRIGVQIDTTGNIYADLEINGEGEEGSEDYYQGELNGTNATVVTFDDAMLAVNAMPSLADVVVVDELPATYICSKNSEFKCAALYYDAETATEEKYAICVTKGKTELLNAINEVLNELGVDGINNLVKKHLGLDK